MWVGVGVGGSVRLLECVLVLLISVAVEDDRKIMRPKWACDCGRKFRDWKRYADHTLVCGQYECSYDWRSA